jgi:sugar lactone lactonase YvrE
LGSLPDDVTIDAPTLSVSLSTIALDTVGANVYVTYTVDQDVDARLSVTGIEDTSATLYKSNNTIVVTAGATEFANGQINLVVSNGRSTDTEVIDVSATNPWVVNLSNIIYDNIELNVKLSADRNPADVAFNNDGTKMYVISENLDIVDQYSLSSAFDISTASYDSVSFNVAAQEGNAQSIEFNNDGTKMYVIGNGSQSVHQYSLSSAFDISTASYDSVSFDVVSQENFPRGLEFNNDGTKMYVIGIGSRSVHQYSLSSAFDISTASYDSVSFNVSGEEGGPAGVAFNNNGTKMYIIGYVGDEVNQYTLSTGFNISTASYDSLSFSTLAQAPNPFGITFNNDGTKMYILGTSSAGLHQYSTGL